MFHSELLTIFPNSQHQALENSRKEAIALSLENNGELGLLISKVGGFGYFPKDEIYPVNSDGQPLRLLAQLNFSELPPLKDYPTKGLLAFYIDEFDDLLGCDFENPLNRVGYKVLYFPECDEELAYSKGELEDLFRRFSEIERYPVVNEEYQLTGTLENHYVTGDSVEFEATYKSEFYNFFEKAYPDSDEAESKMEELFDIDISSPNSIGGYPSFTQTDPRIRMPEFKDDQLLFQLSSTDYGNDVQVIWGDSGIGNFFIHPTDLVNQDFSKTWYNWDCY